MRDIDDLLDEEQPEKEEEFSQTDLDLSVVHGGVSATWLAKAFGMGPPTVKKRLAHCDPIARDKNVLKYSLRQAAAYLVEPKVDIEQYLKSMRPNDLPPLLQEVYWSAALKRQKYEEEAGELWRTEAVLEVFGSLAMTIKNEVSLWVENLDRVHGLTPVLRESITQQTDAFQQRIYELLVSLPSASEHGNLLAEMQEMNAGAAAGEIKLPEEGAPE